MTYSVDNLHTYIIEKNVPALKWLKENGLIKIENGRLFVTEAALTIAKAMAGFWNQRQQATKILLNSLYGALLNEGCLFFDKRLGQSVTLTGRSVSKHMNGTVNEIITGTFDYKGDAVIYADTDSSYFTAYETLKSDKDFGSMVDSKDAMLELYLGIGAQVNESFAPFMDRAFNTGIPNGEIIAAGLELVSEHGLFIKKKRYAVLKFWDEDNGRLDTGNSPGKLKVIGIEVKRSDTPKYMQNFLEGALLDVLQGAKEDNIIKQIRDFRFDVFKKRNPWDKGSPKKVNGLTDYMAKIEQEKKNIAKAANSVGDKKQKRLTVPGHVRAAINWNTLRAQNNDRYSTEMTDGSVIVVCKLKKNITGMTSIAFPYDDVTLPAWFKELPFDEAEMEKIIVDTKVANLFGVMGWDLTKTNISEDLDDLFSF